MSAATSNGHRPSALDLPLDAPENGPNAQAYPRSRVREDTGPAQEGSKGAAKVKEPKVQEMPLKRVNVSRMVSGLMAGESVFHASPPSLHEQHNRHLQAGSALGVPLLRWMRMSWAYFVHMPCKIVIHTVDWILESPVRALIATGLIIAAWYWS